MTDPRVLTLDELHRLAGRLLTASGSLRIPRPLRGDIVAAALVLTPLLRTGIIAGPVNLGGRDG
jgi:hypothetical protein